jgi:quercetin dioxygenase-like cupin family protein
MAGPTRDKIAASWVARGFGCDLWTDPPGRRWEDFAHATDELVTVLEGEMEFEIEGEVHHPKPGEELLIPAGKVHSARNVGKSTARWLYGYKRSATGNGALTWETGR